jgi:DNA-binding transcriptional LysR family regulator
MEAATVRATKREVPWERRPPGRAMRPLTPQVALPTVRRCTRCMYIATFKVFCDLAETGSFSKAAVLNSITQSAVSQQVRALETRFRVTLVERGRRHFALTPEGSVFLQAAREILEVHDNLDARLHQLRNVVEGEIKVASIYSVGFHDLPPLLEVFRERFPKVNVQVSYRRTPQVYSLVADGEADLGLVSYPAKRNGLQIEVFAEDEMILIVAPKHRFAAQKRVSFARLAGEDFIAFEPDLPTRKAIDRHFREQGVSVVHKMEFDNIETVKRAVEIDNGVSIVPRTTVRQEIESGSLVGLEIDGLRMTRPLAVVTKRNRQRSPAQAEFVAVLRQG